MLIGYARVSGSGATLDVQKNALDRANVKELVIDVANGARATRPQWEYVLSKLGRGDILVVWNLDRLARSVRHMIETVTELSRRGIGVRSIEEKIDTSTAMGKLMFETLGRAVAQVEQSVMRERTLDGRVAVSARDRKGGRKPKLDEVKRAQANTLYSQGLPVDEICALLQIAPRTFFRVCRQEKLRKVRRKRKTKPASHLSTDKGRHVGEKSEQATAPKVSPLACAGSSSSSHPPRTLSPRRDRP